MMSRAFFTAWAVSCMAAIAAPASAQQNREFTDWAATCDAELVCEAYTHHVGDDPAVYLFHVTRGQSEETWNLVLEVNGGQPRRPYEIGARLVGAEFDRVIDAASHDSDREIYLLGDNANALMAGLGPASEVVFSITDADGGPLVPHFSLSGLSASLLWIDEMQGRIGSPREAGAVPEGMSPAADGIPEELLIRHHREGECDAFEDLPNGNEFIVADLGGERTLYLLPCSSGAYNFAYVGYIHAYGGYERAWFADYSDTSSWTATPYLVNPDWEPATKRLTMFNKGRGIADCGSIGEWQAYDGYLRLERFFAKDDCDGQGEPGQYPLVFEAKPRGG